MKLKRVNLTQLHNEEHFQFMTVIVGLLNAAAGEVKQFIGTLIGTLSTLLQREDSALEKIRKSILTDPITTADSLRDSIFRGLELIVEGYMHSVVVVEVEAANVIRIVTNHYGNVTKKSYNEETALIHNLVRDLRERCDSALNTLNLVRWVDDLDAANTAFDNLMNERYEETASQNIENVREVRRAMDTVYQQLIAAIEVGAQLAAGSDAYAALINEINQRVEYYRNTLAHRKGTKHKSDEA